jgi:hypothetical protein
MKQTGQEGVPLCAAVELEDSPNTPPHSGSKGMEMEKVKRSAGSRAPG